MRPEERAGAAKPKRRGADSPGDPLLAGRAGAVVQGLPWTFGARLGRWFFELVSMIVLYVIWEQMFILTYWVIVVYLQYDTIVWCVVARAPAVRRARVEALR